MERDESPERDTSESSDCYRLGDMYIAWFQNERKLMFLKPGSVAIFDAEIVKVYQDRGSKWIKCPKGTLYIPNRINPKAPPNWNDIPLVTTTRRYRLPGKPKRTSLAEDEKEILPDCH